MQRLTAIPIGRALAAFLITVVAGLLLAVIFRPGDESAAAVTLGDPTAWIEHGIDGELLQINARTGEVTTRLSVADRGDDFIAIRHAEGAVVLNRTTGVLSLVNGAELTVETMTELSLSDGAEDREVVLFGQERVEDDIFLIDQDQVLQVDPSTGFETPLGLASPITSPLQDETGTILGLDAVRSSVVRVASDGASPFAVVNDFVGDEEDEDGRQLVRAGDSIFALDPIRLSMAEVLPEGGLGEPVCMASSAIGALHGGTPSGEIPTVISVNPELSVLARSSADGTCEEVAISIPVGEYGAPVVRDGIVYLPFFDEGRITTLDVETGNTIASMRFGANGEAFELELVGSTVWANDRSGPFAAVVESTQVTPIAKISAVLAEPGDITDAGDGVSIAVGGDDDSGPRLIGDSGDAVFEPNSDVENQIDDGTVGGGESSADEGELGQSSEPEAFGIPIDVFDSETPDEEEPNALDPLDPLDESDVSVEVEGEVEEADSPALEEGLLADFTLSSAETLVGQAVRFTDASVGDPVLWAWTFGDGTAATTPDVEKSWGEVGEYEVVLTITNATGSSSTRVVTITVSPEDVTLPPNADFRFTSSTIDVGESVSFESRSTGEVDFLEWDFGNGRTGVGAEVTHTYDEVGTYEVVLTASNEAGSTTSSTTIEVVAAVAPPVAAIAPFPEVVVTDQFVTFESESLNDPTRTAWSFGDGTDATGTSARHSWSEPGEYRIVLTVENSEGTDRTFADVTVESRVIEPVSSFTQNQTEVLVGESIRFSDNSANNPERLVWDFDDGTTSNAANPTHSWDQAGEYRVTLRAINDAGADRSGVNITVTEPIDPPVASFDVDALVVATGADARFEDTSTNDPDEWLWDFEGSGTATNPSPFRRWETAGTYTVRLTVANDGGRSSTETEIRVVDRPTAAFRVEMVDDNTFRFVDQSQNAMQWNWDFGDGTTSTDRNPTHDFDGGTFNVSLTTANEVAAAGPARQRVTVAEPPVAVISCEAAVGQLTCTSAGSQRAERFTWSAEDAIDNSNPNAAMTTFTFARATTPDVTLTVTSASGLTDTTTIRAPRVARGFEPRVLDVRVASVDGDLVRLEAEFDRDPNQWQWSIDGADLVSGGDTSSPTFRVPGNGTYTGQVIAANAFGDDRDPVEFTVNSIEPDGRPPRVLDVRVASVDGDLVRLEAEFDREPTEWEWSLNGANLVSGGDTSSPTFRVPEDGTYTGQVIARNDFGADTDPVRVDVRGVTGGNPPSQDLDSSFTWRVIRPGVVQFTNTSTGDADVVFFRFSGEEEVIDDDDNNPVVRYPDRGGTFSVTLVVRNEDDRSVDRQDVIVPPVN